MRIARSSSFGSNQKISMNTQANNKVRSKPLKFFNDVPYMAKTEKIAEQFLLYLKIEKQAD